MSKERVAIIKVKEQQLDAAVQELVDLVGPLQKIVPRGSRVLVKPNYTIVPTDCGITHPELVEAIVRLVAQASPGEIVIAESSGDYYTSYCYRFMGLQRIAARYGARLVDLNVEEGVLTPVPPELGREYVMVPKAVAESDVVISVPILKLWGDSLMSLSLKNFFGLYGARYYGHNKDSAEMVKQHPFFGLPGEVGSERGIHSPSVAQSVCAMNLAVKTHLAIIDALEGGDGAGNWIRLDTLIAGRNPVATDTVGLAMSGYRADEHAITQLCAEHGLGPCRLDEIDVIGERIEDVSFELTRLRRNVLEMPLRYCLNLLSTGELRQVHHALVLYGFLFQSATPPSGRAPLLEILAGVIGSEGYYEAALARCDEHALVLLQLIVDQGGTSGDLVAIRDALSAHYQGNESLHYAPAARTLARLGLAYAVEGLARPYYVLPDGLVIAYKCLRERT
jgi:uncharacterized protein (DUF362 family)